jgi:hypothetical protein
MKTNHPMILHRLIKEGKVVGYQKQEGGRIYHLDAIHERLLYPKKTDYFYTYAHDVRECCLSSVSPTGERRQELINFYIPHDRADTYTGVDLADGTKVFERDKVINDYEAKGTVLFEKGAFVARFLKQKDKHGLPWLECAPHIDLAVKLGLTIIGIEGVKEGR